MIRRNNPSIDADVLETVVRSRAKSLREQPSLQRANRSRTSAPRKLSWNEPKSSISLDADPAPPREVRLTRTPLY